ncbi:ATP-dependent RNA helicase DbpA [bacterium]|nr:ATP-dependent RNA helicase DbpA [bacterium]
MDDNKTQFASLGLNKEMLEHLASIGYSEMTPIQQEALPHLIKGKDIVAKAKTGSGKTATFGIAILHNIKENLKTVQSLVITPTRELSEQVANEIRKLAKSIGNIKVLVLSGGVPIRPQLESLLHTPHIVVGTAGRLLQHIKKGSLDISKIKSVVLDEGDRMLQMGFFEDMIEILKDAPKKRQTMLFSATFPKEIKEIASQFLKDPISITIDTVHTEATIKTYHFPVGKGGKNGALLKVLAYFNPNSVLIFCNTKQMVKDLTDILSDEGLKVQGIHGDLEQQDRALIFARFKNGSYPILIATDVAARGLDIRGGELSDGVDLVVNYELPMDPEVYTHRNGRTGRAGDSGVACSLFTQSEKHRLEAIEKFISKKIEIDDLETLIDSKSYNKEVKWATVSINGGKKQKIRKADILGALTSSGDISGDDVGVIEIGDFYSYIAVKPKKVSSAKKNLSEIKRKAFKVMAHL